MNGISNKQKIFPNILRLNLFLIIFVVIVLPAYGDDQVIPDWVWHVSEFWKNGDISDSEFLTTISYLADERIVTLSEFSYGMPILFDDIIDNFGEKYIQNFGEKYVQTPIQEPVIDSEIIWMMKDLSLDATIDELQLIKNTGFDVITTSWGIEQDVYKARNFLNNAESVGLKVVMDAGFSYYAWGFTDEDWQLSNAKKPVWQKQLVQNWVSTLKDHPAIYGWDISNEAGENFPKSKSPDLHDVHYALTLGQISIAKKDVIAVDPTRPIFIRMHPWDTNLPSFDDTNPFAKNIADIVMLNIYSNFIHEGSSNPELIENSGQYYVDEIKNRDPNVKIWLALASFEELPSFKKPSTEEIGNDIAVSKSLEGVEGIGFYLWSTTSKYGEEGNLSEIHPDLWNAIKSELRKD